MIILKRNQDNEIYLSIGEDIGLYNLEFEGVEIELLAGSFYAERYKRFVLPSVFIDSILDGEGVLRVFKDDEEVYKTLYFMPSEEIVEEEDFMYQG